MRLICLLMAIFSILSCQSPLYIIVTVDGIPANGQSIVVLADHAGFAATEDPAPFELPQLAPTTASLLLNLPNNFHGDVGISIGVFEKPNGGGCLLATGGGREDPFVGPGDSLRILLTPVPAVGSDACTGKRPLVLTAEPRLVSSEGGQKVKLTGWGFLPGTTSTIGGQAAETVYISANELRIVAPAVPSLGRLPVTIKNSDLESTTYDDLLKIYAGKLAFLGLPGSTGNYAGLSALTFGRYNPTSVGGFAFALSTQDKVRVDLGTFPITSTKYYPVGMAPSSLFAIDIDKDGDLDLLVANAASNTVQIMMNDGMGAFPDVRTIPGIIGPSSIVAGDIDNDGDIDIVAVSKSTRGVYILLNDGSGLFTDNGDGRGSGGQEPVSVALGDLNSDNLLDIAIANRDKGAVTLLFNNPSLKGHFRGGMPDVPIFVGTGSANVILSDIDGNGVTDLIASATGSNKVAVYTVSQTNAMRYDLATEAEPKQIIVQDVNGDGFGDLIVACSGSNTINIFLNNLGLGFKDVQYQSIPSPCTAPALLAGIDVGNGLSHLVVGRDGCVAVLANQSK